MKPLSGDKMLLGAFRNTVSVFCCLKKVEYAMGVRDAASFRSGSSNSLFPQI